jgi:hypothetical protein
MRHRLVLLWVLICTSVYAQFSGRLAGTVLDASGAPVPGATVSLFLPQGDIPVLSDIEDTTGKGARGPLPDEAGEVESVVGLFDSERGSGTLWTADEFAQFAPRRLTRKLWTKRRFEVFDRAEGTCSGAGAGVEISGKLELEYLS